MPATRKRKPSGADAASAASAEAKKKMKLAEAKAEADEMNDSSDDEDDSSDDEGDSSSDGEGDSSSDDSSDSDDDDTKAKKPKVTMKFRNYHPMDKKLKECKLDKVATQDQQWLKDELSLLLSFQNGSELDKEVDLNNIAPKKLNWDLKRDFAAKLEVMDQQTQRAILELIRDKAEAQEKEQNEDSDSDSDSDSSSSSDSDSGDDDDKDGSDSD